MGHKYWHVVFTCCYSIASLAVAQTASAAYAVTSVHSRNRFTDRPRAISTFAFRKQPQADVDTAVYIFWCWVPWVVLYNGRHCKWHGYLTKSSIRLTKPSTLHHTWWSKLWFELGLSLCIVSPKVNRLAGCRDCNPGIPNPGISGLENNVLTLLLRVKCMH